MPDSTTNPRILANARRGLALANEALRQGRARRCSRTRRLSPAPRPAAERISAPTSNTSATRGQGA